MSWIQGYLKSSIGKKQVVAVTGLMLCGFLTTHLLGNLLLLKGAEAFNTYSHLLISNPLILVAEIGLLLVFVTHIALALTLAVQNRRARPVSYYKKVPTGRGQTIFSSTMPYTGMIILVFLVIHILQFRFGTHYTATYNGIEMRDLYRLVIEVFASPLYVAWYVFAQIATGWHLSHGFASSFATLGLDHPKYTPFLEKLGIAFAIFISVGFSSLPLWAYFQQGQ